MRKRCKVDGRAFKRLANKDNLPLPPGFITAKQYPKLKSPVWRGGSPCR